MAAELSALVEADAVTELADSPRVPGSPPDEEVIASAMVDELQAVLGVGARPAGRLIDLAHRLTTVLPDTLTALREGRLDLTRARILAEATQGLFTADARAVQDQMLGYGPGEGSGPGEGCRPEMAAWARPH